MAADLPRRTRSHQLEENSRHRFGARLPDHLSFKENPPPEYGIDGWVEAFDKHDDTARGVRFDVQIKSTDEADLSKALKVRLKSSTINYFGLLDRPVLIVVHHGPTDEFYVKWFHSEFDFRLRPGQESATFDCTNGRVLDDSVADALVEEAAAYQRFAHGGFRPPADVFVDVEPTTDIVGLDLILALREVGAGVTDVVVFDQVPQPGKTRVSVSNAIAIDLGGIVSVRVEVDRAATAPTDVAVGVLLGLAVAFGATRHFEAAARLAEAALPHSGWQNDLDLMAHVLVAFIGSRRIRSAMRLAEMAAESGALEAAEHLASVGVFVPAMTDDEHAAFVRAHDAIRVAGEARGDINRVASSHYSMGNAYRARCDLLQAIRHYRLAARHNPGYRDRAYFWRELGGVLYLAGRPVSSARAYRCAVQLGEDTPFVRGLLGDALMQSGRFEDALREFELAADEDPNWGVKRHAMGILLASGFRAVHRRTHEAETLVTQAVYANASRDEMIDACRRAIVLDPLSGLAWFNLGVAIGEGDMQAAFDAFVLTVCAQEGDVEAWWNACLCGFNGGGDPGLAADVMASAVRLNGDKFITKVSDWTRGVRMDSQQRAEFLTWVEEMAAAAGTREADPVIRTSELGPGYEELRVLGSNDE